MMKKDVNLDKNFVSDYDKMRDFEILTKDEFLNSYSYLTEEEYDATQSYLNWIKEKENRANDWIPVSSGEYPEDNESVQVTYIGCIDGIPYCEAFAYRRDGKWYWAMDTEEVRVKITAWKPNCKPYTPPTLSYSICIGVDGYLLLDVDAMNLEEAKNKALDRAIKMKYNQLSILNDVELRFAGTSWVKEDSKHCDD